VDGYLVEQTGKGIPLDLELYRHNDGSMGVVTGEGGVKVEL